MHSLEALLDRAHGRREAGLADYRTFLSIPSISGFSEHAGDVARAAQWLADYLTRLGMQRVDIIKTPLHPMVCGEWLGAPGKPTVLVYGHYDVQPIDPEYEWITPPFAGDIRDEAIYARGAADMKGSLWALLTALECFETPPVNLKFLLEGEEEIGSPSMEGFLAAHRDRVEADIVLNLDGNMHSAEQPSITFSLRGLAYFELEIWGPERDLHSGMFGGAILNPIQALCELIAGMHDAQGRVMLPGFYDTVRPLEAEERALLAQVSLTEEDWRATTGVPASWGEEGYTILERIGVRPTIEVNGIVGGFIGEGSKTVLPARALAKISTRLVADQDAAAIRAQLEAYITAHAPAAIRWELRELSHGPGSTMDLHSPFMKTAQAALTTVFGKAPVFKREGGSVPIVGMLQQALGVDSIMLGFCLPDAFIHSPNEKQHLPTLFRGIDVYIHFLHGLATRAE